MFKSALRGRFLLPLLALVLLLTACQKQHDPPLSYEISGYTIPSLHQILGEEAAVLDSFELPPEPSPEEAGTGKGIRGQAPAPADPAVIPPQQVYFYSALTQGGLDAQRYVEGLMADPDLDLNPVNAAGRSVPLPDFSEDGGFVLLSMADLERESMLRVLVSWAEEGICTVKVSIVDATRRARGEPAEAPTAGPEGSLTAEETVSYFQGLSPTLLNLEGEQMSSYDIYYLDGKVLVNGEACSRVRVYSESAPEGSNAYVGTFLVTGSRSHLYSLDLLTNEVTELGLSALPPIEEDSGDPTP